MSQHDDQNDAAYMAALERENAELTKENNRLRTRVGEPRQADGLAFSRGADRAKAKYTKAPKLRDGAGTHVTYNN